MKILVSDYDGTIFRNRDIDNIDRMSINNFISNKNNKFIIATGRGGSSFKKTVKLHDVNFFNFAILSNGAIIIDNKGNVIYDRCLKEDCVYEIFNYIKDQYMDGSRVFVCGVDYQFTLTTKDEIANFLREKLNSIINNIICITIELPEEDIAMARKVSDDIESLNKLSDVAVSRNSRYIDMVCKGISKKTAVNFIIDKYNLQDYELAAIGDGPNDINLLSMTENSFTFPDSEKIVKDNAKYIVSNLSECIELL